MINTQFKYGKVNHMFLPKLTVKTYKQLKEDTGISLANVFTLIEREVYEQAEVLYHLTSLNKQFDTFEKYVESLENLSVQELSDLAEQFKFGMFGEILAVFMLEISPDKRETMLTLLKENDLEELAGFITSNYKEPITT